MAVGGRGGDLAFACGFQGDGEHALAFLRARYWRMRSAVGIALPVGGRPRLGGGFCVTEIGGGITVTGVFIVTLGRLFVTLSTGFFVTLSACRRTSRASACLSWRWSILPPATAGQGCLLQWR
jgi:hypothetical protein